MAADAGRNFLLKIGTGTNATTVAAQRETSFEINGETVDITTKDSAGKRDLGAQFGKSSLSISARGVLTGVAASTTLAGYAEDRTLNAFTLAYDNSKVITASFQVTKFSAAGSEGGEQTYELTLESSGDWSLT